MSTTPLVTPSTVKVLDLNSGATIAVIPTGTGAGSRTPGIRRADELCYSPKSKWSWLPMTDPLDNFITFINADTFGVMQRISFDGHDPNGDNILANGIEQCVFNPQDGNFYRAIPATGRGGIQARRDREDFGEGTCQSREGNRRLLDGAA